MGDPTRAEPRNPTVGGETAQETVDRMAGGSKIDGGVKGATLTPTAPAPQNLHPSAKGVYGAPIGKAILGGGK